MRKSYLVKVVHVCIGRWCGRYADTKMSLETKFEKLKKKKI